MGKFEYKKYCNPDGSIKRLLEVSEILPDGTRVFENGSKAAPSIIDFGGERGLVRLDSLSAKGRQEWEENLMKKVGKGMSDYYFAILQGAGKYGK